MIKFLFTYFIFFIICDRNVSICNDCHIEWCTNTSREQRITAREMATILEKTTVIPENVKDAREQLRLAGYEGTLNCKSNAFIRRVVKEQHQLYLTNYQDSFRYIQSKLQMLKESNPGSIIVLQTLDVQEPDGGRLERRFYRLLCVLGACIETSRFCKPVLSLDAGALKHISWAGYNVMVCSMQDGENRDCILGFAIVPSEDEANYRWILQNMKQNDTLNEVFKQPGFVVITDRAKGLLNAVREELPTAHHRFCALHLLGNVPSPSFTEEQRRCYWDIVRSKSTIEFNSYMEMLQDTHPLAYNYLSGIDPKLWVDFAQPVSTWGMCTNNLSERAVKIIGSDCNKGRTLCPMQIIDRVLEQLKLSRNKIVKEISDCSYNNNQLTNYAMQKFEKVWKYAQYLLVSKPFLEPSEETTPIYSYKVSRVLNSRSAATGHDALRNISEDRQDVTQTIYQNHADWKCTCKQRSTQGIPCVHICAVHQSLSLTKEFFQLLPQRVHSSYLATNYKSAYSKGINLCFSGAANLIKNDILGPVSRNLSKSILGKRIRSKSAKHSGNRSGKVPKQMSASTLRGILSNVSTVDAQQFVKDMNSSQNNSNGLITQVNIVPPISDTQEISTSLCESSDDCTEFSDSENSENFFSSFSDFLQNSVSTVLNYLGNNNLAR